MPPTPTLLVPFPKEKKTPDLPVKRREKLVRSHPYTTIIPISRLAVKLYLNQIDVMAVHCL